MLLDPADVPRVAGVGRTAGRREVRVDDLRVSIPVRDRTRALVNVATSLREAKIEPEDITLRRPTLDEVFLHLTKTEVAV